MGLSEENVITSLETQLEDNKFDVVVGNPPYQDPNKGYKGLATLWPKFSKKAINLLKTDGVVGFVTPPSWMSPGSDLLPLFKEKDLKIVDLDCGKHFKVGSAFSYWILQNSKYSGTTSVIQNNKVTNFCLSNYEFIPNTVNSTIFSILDKTVFSDKPKFESKINSECHTQKTDKVSSTEDSKFCYPVKHTNSVNVYSAAKHSNFSKNKVLFPLTGTFTPTYDGGTIGTGQNVVWIEVLNEDEGKVLIWFLKESNIMKAITEFCKWSGANTRGVFMDKLPKIDLTRSWSDQELYTHFNLTQEEIDFVEAYFK